MKVAVYTIAKNEEQFCRRWADNTKDADYRIVGDTGSEDATAHKLKLFGVQVIRGLNIQPFRFDMARNTVLSMVPADTDWCIALDMDEMLDEGWRDKLDDLGTRKQNVYHWSPEYAFLDDRRIHRRFGYAWRYPCHEELYAYGGVEDELVDSPVVIRHFPDAGKARGYLDILAPAATAEYPTSSRMQFYYGRELCFHNRYDEAVDYFRRCALQQMQGLQLPTTLMPLTLNGK